MTSPIINYLKQNHKVMCSFIVIGVLSTLINLIIFNVLLKMAISDYKLALALAYLIATIFNFIANRYFNFESNTKFGVSVYRYVIMLAINYLGTILIIAGCEKIFDFNASIGQLIGVCLMMLINFLLGRHWIFQATAKGNA